MSEIPQPILERIKILASKHKIDQQNIHQRLLELFNNPQIQNDKTLPTATSKYDYCIKVLDARLGIEIKYDNYNIIVTGISKIMTTKSNKLMANVFVAVQEKDDNNNQILCHRSITWMGDSVKRIKDIQPMMGYSNVSLGKFSSGDFQADDRTYFNNPVITGIKPLDLLTKLGVRSCTIAQSIDNLAKIEGKYPVRTDWRVIRGMIVGQAKGPYASGKGEYSLYSITDESLDSDLTTSNGITIPKRFTVSLDRSLMVYKDFSVVAFAGILQLYKETVQMEAYYVYPIHTPFGQIINE